MFRRLQRSARLRRLVWNWRNVRALPARSDEEMAHRLRRLAVSSPGNIPGVVRFPWGELGYANAGNLASQFEEIFLRRQYAFDPAGAVPVIIDCGGNIGLSAIWFKQHHPQCQLRVYEPDPALSTLLAANLSRAGFTDVDLRRAAAWTADGAVSFSAHGDDSGRISDEGAVQIPAVDLARDLPAHVDLLKMDIEGAEFAVLDHLCATGAITRVRRLVCEFHILRERTDDALRTLAHLRASGFEVSLHAAPLPWLGVANRESPFAMVGRQHVLAEVFAWRESR